MPQTPPSSESAPQLESGTYEILRNRLKSHSDLLREKLRALNDDRKQVFGSVDLKLLHTERITTDNNCVPRDVVVIGNRLLLGFNVQFGLKAERHPTDVFALFEYDAQSHSMQSQSLELLQDATFHKDFQDIYRYYKNAVFSRFFVRGPHLYMVFQVGKTPADVKSFKWLIDGDDLRYLDNRSDHEVRLPPQHEFDWIRSTRDAQRHGPHPHVSIEDRLFVETVGGDLTIKVENNTETGEGIYSEPVDQADQTLDDAEIHYALVGHLILLKIRPYQETRWRYFVFNEKTQQALRLDALADACLLLPDDQGLVFANGYYLQTGERKIFDTSLQGLVFDRRIVSPNGEDTLYVFYQPDGGSYVQLGYNVIEQAVETPLICQGFATFSTGQMVQFKAANEPQKHHAVQIWQTPYVGEDFQQPRHTDSYLYKIGNRDIVRGMAECHEILSLVDKEDTYAGLYVDLVKLSSDLLDSYYWINHADAGNLAEPLRQIKETASAAVAEFEKVVRVRKSTHDEVARVTQRVRQILNDIGRGRFDRIEVFVKSLADLRAVRGEIVSLRELRYVDPRAVETLEKDVTEQTERLSHRCVEFLLQEAALQPYDQAIATERQGIPELEKVTNAKEADARVVQTAHELEMLIEIVSNLKIDDATRRTSIIDSITAVFSKINATRAALKARIEELSATEGAAEFASQTKLLDQSVANYLDICNTPERCEEYLTKLLVQVEELEGKFAEFDQFVIQLASKREEIAGAFETRRMQLVERRNKRAATLAQAAERILKGIQTRIGSLPTLSEIHGYFASDLMVEKVRGLIGELLELGDSVKSESIESQLKTIREDAVRQLKDKQDLFEDGQQVIRFGKHRFTVNTQALDLTTVVRDHRLWLHLTGTEFYEPLENPALGEPGPIWEMEVPSENEQVYRGEFLAYQMLKEHRQNGTFGSASEYSVEQLLPRVQKFMSPRFQEGYIKGVHDQDAAAILSALLKIDDQCGLLRYSGRARALAALYWKFGNADGDKQLMALRLAGMAAIRKRFPQMAPQPEYLAQMRQQLRTFAESYPQLALQAPNAATSSPVDGVLTNEAAAYLYSELSDPERANRGDEFVASQAAVRLSNDFQKWLSSGPAPQAAHETLEELKSNPVAAFGLARDWIAAFLASGRDDKDPRDEAEPARADELSEAALQLISQETDQRAVVSAALQTRLEGLAGSHAVIRQGTYELNFTDFLQKLARFETVTLPAYRQFHEAKESALAQARAELNVAEFQPRVLTSFVRNRLIDTVYLPLVGDNLAKQIGTAGADKRTDRQGLLLLISPPGYGKTTLMEYIANRLGLIFMKINGPAIGHSVTSLDPGSAPNAGAREEIKKLNLAFEMGDNVMIYVDDIQHCHPEFLQKFISLCDAQRKIEGVWQNDARTYDFRGKKVAVVMAGNPYTESGEAFKIPDMLANRADIYNLGEIIGDSASAFEMSYLENALTSNSVLTKLAGRSQKDVQQVIKFAEKSQAEETAPSAADLDLEGSYAPDELEDFISVMEKLIRVRDVVLRVNQEYIASAAQHDDYRTQPPFLLQGSYRNMNRIAQRVVPLMNADELNRLILTSYQSDAQTLTTGTEANLLKFKEMVHALTPDEQARWEDICRTYRQNLKLRGLGADDKVGQVIATLMTFADGLESIRRALSEGAASLTTGSTKGAASDQDALQQRLSALAEQSQQTLQCLDQLSQRPIRVEMPPLEMRWPETPLAVASPLPVAAQEAAPPVGEPEPIPIAGAETVETEGESAATSAERITVINRLPKSVYQVISQQFELMEAWLKPLTELTVAQRKELSELRPMIEEVLRTYRTLMRKLEQAKRRER